MGGSVMSEQQRSGARHLGQALSRFRQARRQAAAEGAQGPPLDLRPTTPFELEILHQYTELRRDYEELKKRVDWLTMAIIAAALTLVLERIFAA